MILDAVPKQVVAGDTWRWTRPLSDYPAPTWAVTYYFENEAKQFSSLATADGTSQAVSISATTTADIPEGRYRWYARAVSGAIVEMVSGENGWLDVLPNIGASGTHDHRSWARRALDAVRAQIEDRATDGQKSMTIAGRSIERIPYAELKQMKEDLEAQVRAEEAGSNAGKGRRIKIRFG